MSNIVIDIAAEFVGKPAFKQAETSTDKLSKSVKTLAKTLGLAFSVTAVAAFGKASLKAFTEDEAAATRLSQAVKNLGLGFEDARIKTFIADLEQTAVVADDKLRPAFQSLLTTTGSVATSQKLLQLAIDVSAGSTEDLATVSKDLSLAYVGQTKGLKKYDLGLSTAELSAANFETIQKKLNEQFAGQNAARLDTYAGKVEAVDLALGNAKETIGEGLFDAFAILGGDSGIGSVTNAINEMATAASESIVSLSLVVAELQKIPIVSQLLDRLKNPLGLSPENLGFGKGGLLDQFRELSQVTKNYGGIYATKYLGELEAANAAARKKAELEAAKRAKALLDNKNKQLLAEQKALAAKKLAAAIDKANLALGKGSEVFDMDKIQIAAALTSQAEALGKATSSSQILQIANDVARLNVKKSILALEDAIAAKDEAAIIAATNKLNADLKVLGTLGAQNLKLLDIKSLLESLKPKDLINIANLEAALALLGKINLASTGSTKAPSGVAASGITVGDKISPISTKGGSIEAILEYAESATARANAFADLLDMQTAADAAAFNASSIGNSAGNNFVVTINTGVGDPNAIAEAIENVMRSAQDRGTLRAI